MKRTINLLLGFFGVLVGLGFIMPAVALLRARGALPGSEVGLLLLGLALALGGAGVIWAGMRKRAAD